MMENNYREIIIEPLTPIFTGDANGRSIEIIETGILGSLRYWYEILQKSQNKNCCDPTDTKCRDGKRCIVCELFGCTGWSRKFRLLVTSENSKNIRNISISSRKEVGRKLRARKVEGFVGGSVKLEFIALRKITDAEWENIRLTLKMMEKHMAIGARIAQGNGVFKIKNCSLGEEGDKKRIDEWEKDILKDYFFDKYIISFIDKSRVLSPNDDEVNTWENIGSKLWTGQRRICQSMNNCLEDSFLPIAFHIRDCIRRSILNCNKRHEIFGKIKGSSIFVSHAYKISENDLEFRIWGKKGEQQSYNGELLFIDTIIYRQLNNYLHDFLFNEKEENMEVKLTKI